MRRILYLQYTNPGGYPALAHSSQMLAHAGWEILFLGTEARGTAALEVPEHPQVTVRKLRPCESGWKAKLHYTAFAWWALFWSVRWRPDWIYASDPLSCLAALTLRRIPGVRVLYHEHDFPVARGSRQGFHRWVMRARSSLARQAELCVLPNHRRARHFRLSTGTVRPVECVWNCPRSTEALPPRRDTEAVTVHYHGNLGPELLPLTLLQAVAMVPGIQLQIIGYTTSGQDRYPQLLHEEAARLGISGRVKVHRAMPRAALLEKTRTASLGIALMPMSSTNPNFRWMVGASNKPFDYLACGVPVLVSELPEWRKTFVEPGYGLACNPTVPGSIAQALRWALTHRPPARLMGELGRQRILAEWNYERQFDRVGGALGALAPLPQRTISDMLTS